MSGFDPTSLNGKILAAYECEDMAALAELYVIAAKHKRDGGDAEAAGFLLTQAYVYALDSGHPSSKELREILISEGREQKE